MSRESFAMHAASLAVLTLLCAAPFRVTAQAAAPTAPSLEIVECVVFSESDAKARYDCTAKARELCGNGSSGRCELPIGLVLSGGKDLDGNRSTWEKVRVKFRCGPIERINGPHHQNDHATALLACSG